MVGRGRAGVGAALVLTVTVSGCAWWDDPVDPPNDIDAARIQAVLADPAVGENVNTEPATTDGISANADVLRARILSSTRVPESAVDKTPAVIYDRARSLVTDLTGDGWELRYVNCLTRTGGTSDLGPAWSVDALKTFQAGTDTFTASMSLDIDAFRTSANFLIPYHLDPPGIEADAPALDLGTTCMADGPVTEDADSGTPLERPGLASYEQ